MINWGYKVLEDGRTIDFNKTDLTIAKKLCSMVPDLNTCIACGECTSTCSAGTLTKFNFRKLHTLIRRGQYQNALEEAEKCMLCGKCIIICPRGINTRSVIISIRQIFKHHGA